MAAVGFLSPARGFLGYDRRRLHSWGEPPFSSLPEISPFFRFRRSIEAAPEAMSTEEGTPPSSVEIPFETPKRTSSLISTINVQKAIRGIEITNVDHYGRLGIARGDSYDKVDAAYAKMCEDTVNQGLDQEESNRRIGLLKESYDILSSEEERRLYDWSLARNEMPDRYVWPFEVDITQTPTQPPPPQEDKISRKKKRAPLRNIAELEVERSGHFMPFHLIFFCFKNWIYGNHEHRILTVVPNRHYLFYLITKPQQPSSCNFGADARKYRHPSFSAFNQHPLAGLFGRSIQSRCFTPSANPVKFHSPLSPSFQQQSSSSSSHWPAMKYREKRKRGKGGFASSIF